MTTTIFATRTTMTRKGKECGDDEKGYSPREERVVRKKKEEGFLCKIDERKDGVRRRNYKGRELKVVRCAKPVGTGGW